MKSKKFIKLLSAVLVLAMGFAFTAAALPPAENSGENTVYIMTDAKGKAEKLIFTDAIISALEKGSGRGLPVTNSDGTVIDCGNQDGVIPIKMSISYTLDGKKISPKRLAGKDGHVVIRYDFENLSKTEAMIGGQKEEIFVPFAVVTGLMLDNEKFSNISVSSGKVISDGSRSVVAGISLPGLQDNLDISKDLIELPEYVEISADVKDFELAMSLCLVTNDIFDGKDLSYDTADIEAMFNQLRKAMDMLIDGAAQLYDGICLLSDKSTELVDGVTQLNNGMQELDSHSAELVGGAEQVFNSLLAMANQQIAEKGLECPQLTIGNYNDVLGALIDSLSPESMIETIKAQIVAKLEPVRPEFRKTAELIVGARLEELARQEEYAKIAAQVEAEQGPELREKTANAVKAEVALEVTDDTRTEIVNNILAERGVEDYFDLSPIERAAVDAASVAAMANPETVKRIADETDARMASEEIQQRIESKVQDALKVTVGLRITEQASRIEHDVRVKVEEQIQLPENQEIIEEHTEDLMQEAVAKALKNELVNNIIMQQAEEGVKQLTEALANLNAYAQFYYGVKVYTEGVSTAANGVATLYSNMPTLVSGVNQLKDGGKMLYDGVLRFDREAISRITNSLDGEIGQLRDRIKASADAAKNYKPIDGLSEGSAVSFVYRSAAIGE